MLSVILPVYNGEKFLRGTLYSVLNQKNIDLEVVVIDDGSKDNSLEICKEIEEMDTRVRVYFQNNSGVSAARNYGISLARGEYIAFLDQDDIYLENALGDAMQILIEKKTDFVKFARKDITVINGVETKVTEYNKFKNCSINEENIGENYTQLRRNMMFSSVWNGIYKKEFLDKKGIRFDDAMRGGCEDQYFNLCLIASDFNAVYVPNVGYLHYIRKGVSTSTKFSTSMIDALISVCELETMQCARIGLSETDYSDVFREYAWRMATVLVRCPDKGSIGYSIQKLTELYNICACYEKKMPKLIRKNFAFNIVNVLFHRRQFALIGFCIYIVQIKRRCVDRWK